MVIPVLSLAISELTICFKVQAIPFTEKGFLVLLILNYENTILKFKTQKNKKKKKKKKNQDIFLSM